MSLSTCSEIDIPAHSRGRLAVFHNFFYPTTFPLESLGLECPFRGVPRVGATPFFPGAYYETLGISLVVERGGGYVNEGDLSRENSFTINSGQNLVADKDWKFFGGRGMLSSLAQPTARFRQDL